MSNGGGESGKEFEKSNWPKRVSRNEEFVQGIAKMAVAQVCESSGFQVFQRSALDTLSDIAVRYINEIGKIASSSANMSGRTECNVFDILQGLEDLGMSQGFTGASEHDRCITESGVVREISEYVEFSEQIPFAYSIPRFPVVKERKLAETFLKSGESPSGEHIPSWLPAFPDPETYMPSSTDTKLVGNEGMDVSGKVEDSKKVEGSLSYMHQLLDSNATEMPVSVDRVNASFPKRVADSNPFTAAPLRFGEKEVSRVILPAKLLDDNAVLNHADAANNVSDLDVFASANDAVENCTFDSTQTRKKALLENRPAVQFKLQTSKKRVGRLMNFLSEEGAELPSSNGNNNMKEEKKIKAEQILKESLENQQELAGSFVN